MYSVSTPVVLVQVNGCFTRVADGIELFEEFLKSEFSDENIQFWKACERFKTLPKDTLKKEAEAIFEEYIAPHAPKMVNY